MFAAIVALFYRGRAFPTSIVFAVHLHAFAFLALTASEAVKFTGSVPAAVTAGVLAWTVLIAYVLNAFRRVYGGGWPAVVGRTLGIAVVYLVASLPALLLILLWAAL